MAMLVTIFAPYLIDMNLVCPNSALSAASSSACLLFTCGRSILFSTTTLYIYADRLHKIKRQYTHR